MRNFVNFKTISSAVILFVLLTFIATDVKAQSFTFHYRDSLLKVLADENNSVEKVNTLFELSFYYSMHSQDTMWHFINEGKAISEKLNYANGTIQYNLIRGIDLFNRDQLDSALIVLEKTRLLLTHHFNAKLLSLTYNYIAFSSQTKSPKIGLAYAKKGLEIAEHYHLNFEKCLNTMAMGACYQGLHNDSNMIFHKKGLALAKANDDFENQGWSDLNIASNYIILSKADEALPYIKDAQKVFIEIGDQHGIAKSYLFLTYCWQMMENYNSCIETAYAGYKYFKSVNDTENIISMYWTISNTHIMMYQYRTALDDLSKSITYSSQVKDTGWSAVFLGAIGLCYVNLHQPDSAMDYIQKGIEYSKKIKSVETLNSCFRILGFAYVEKKQYSIAWPYLQQSYDSALILNDEITAYESLRKMAIICRDAPDSSLIKIGIPVSKRYDRSLNYFENYLSFDKRKNDQEGISEILREISKVYIKKGNFKTAFEILDSSYAIHDSAMLAGKLQDITRREMQFKFDEEQIKQKLIQDKKDEAAIADIRNEKIIRNFSIIAFVFTLLIVILLYRQFQSSRKAEQILAEKNIQIANERDRAERSEKFKQQFLANMSHEIRTPMNAVSGMTDLLLETGPRPDQLEYLKAISKSSQILLHIINDILDLSKIEAGKLDIESIDFSIAEVIQQVKDTLSYRAEEKGLQFLTHIEKSVHDVVIGDPFRLNQVLMNLVGNAIKFTEKGAVQINVATVNTKENKLMIKFSVTDTGIGIPDEKIKTLFSDYSQANVSDSRVYGGTGLGLSISSKLVTMMNGKMEVHSDKGFGTTFSFVLPLVSGSAENLQQRIHSEQQIDGSVLNGLRILVADDNEYNRLVVNETLKLKSDVTVDLVTNGQEAIQLIKRNRYDVVLMDVQMPVLDGIEATKFIRKELDEPNSKVPIIALTASVLRSDLELCAESGMNSYLAKPFKAWQLIQAIAALTNRSVPLADSPQIIKETVAEARTINQQDSNSTNLKYLDEFCEGDKNRMEKYIRLYIKAIPAFESRLLTAINNNDFNKVHLLVHSFKPRWMMMGMGKAKELATQIDLLTETGDQEIFNIAGRLLTETKNSVSELLNQLENSDDHSELKS